MSLIAFKALAGLFIFITSLIAVIYPLRLHKHPSHHHFLELADALASGIFLGVALFHMLPDAIQGFALHFGSKHLPYAEIFCALGFLVLLSLERLSIHTANEVDNQKRLSLVIASILIIHSFIEGTALGINTSLATATVIFLAILAHKSSESFAFAVTLNRGNLAKRTLLRFVILFVCMTPLGLALGTQITEYLSQPTTVLLQACFNAFAAGSFLFMSTLHHINHHHRANEKEGIAEYGVMLIGLLLMAGLAAI